MELVYDYMHGDQVVRGNSGALFDPYKYSGNSRLYIYNMYAPIIYLPKVFSVKKIPCRCVADDLSVFRLLDHRMLPKFGWHWNETKRSEELVSRLKHF